MARVRELAWITEHEEDIDSDLSVFHRIDDPDELDGPRYFRLVERLKFYPGAVQNAALMERQQRDAGPQIPVMLGQQVVKVNDAAAAAALTQGHGPGFPTIGYRS